ncbi:hypothetical protein GCM10011515_03140 [Tsuneonella deserti]|uniref:DUF4352 domain-containing protein n=1 Tax=Tsuneonella deserti TaxID=2035528 RepID=A0ABQ1RY67_9SPHN|nr:hypothetical protein [Tsuneonella deserti]GGD87034.1 hypothetical protein GCM10011515_03140 [Tsuneonella deserti]
MDEFAELLKTIFTGALVLVFALVMGAAALWQNLWEEDISASDVEISDLKWQGSIPTVTVAALITNHSDKAISDFDVVVEGFDCPVGHDPQSAGWDTCYFLAQDDNTFGAYIPAGRSYRYDASFTIRPNSEIEGELYINVKFANFEGN